jgi:hypothetical protein
MGDEKLKDFNLVGGTALSLQIGHRMSIDIDLFSGERFSVEALKEHLSTHYDNFRENRTNEFTVISTLEDDIKVDFISYPYLLIGNIVKEDHIRMYSLDDISAMKLSAIGNNGTRLKDFVDIVCLSSYFSFNRMLENFEKKFPVANAMHIIRSVGYHDDIVHGEIKMINCQYDWKSAQKRIFDMLGNPGKQYQSFPFSNEINTVKRTDKIILPMKFDDEKTLTFEKKKPSEKLKAKTTGTAGETFTKTKGIKR